MGLVKDGEKTMEALPLIYVVEDSKLYLAFITRILSNHGYRVESSTNATSALNYLKYLPKINYWNNRFQ